MAAQKEDGSLLNAGSKVVQNAPREHPAILSTFVKLPFVHRKFVLTIFEGSFKTGFTVWVSTQENIYFGFPSRYGSNQPTSSFTETRSNRKLT